MFQYLQKNQEIENLLKQLEEEDALLAASDSVKSTPVHNKAVATLRGNGTIVSRRGSAGKLSNENSLDLNKVLFFQKPF